MLSEQQTANAFSKIIALLGHKMENSFHMETNPQNLLPPDFGVFLGENVLVYLFLKKQLLYLTMELSFPQIPHQLGLMLLFRTFATFSTSSS